MRVFVYGTLMPGHHNDQVWEGLIAEHTKAILPGYKLTTGGSFPYAIPATGHKIRGVLLEPFEGAETFLLERLDKLEGVPWHYERVEICSGVWMYVSANPDHDGMLREVPDGDWERFDVWGEQIGSGITV